MRVTLPVLLLATALCGCTAANARSKTEAPARAVSAADFFFYSCVHEYLKTRALPVFDGSMAYAVEFSDLEPQRLDRLHAAARKHARTIRAPDLSDPEHGRPAVLALCREGARDVAEH
jgi:hypothetical protein